MEKERLYTEAELVEFGNYLLSEERKNDIVNIHFESLVNDADICNWRDKKEQ